jgi:hypothetical protein
MSLSQAIVLIVLLDAALIGLLAFVMSRASRLTPHLPSGHEAPAAVARTETAQPEPIRIPRRPRRKAPARALTARS